MEQDNLYSLPTNLNATECYYKGEGNANLVIALRSEQKVIRIPKHEGDYEKEQHNSRVRISLVYFEHIILPLFSREFFELPKLGVINKYQVKNLNEMLTNVRPTFRQHKEIRPGYVTVFNDLTLLPNTENFKDISQNPVFCVELKPKQGWIAPRDRKFRKCTFCLNQYLKMSNNAVKNMSDYCPLDLFSGVETRMLNAIKHLLTEPQNNIRIFHDGNLVFGDEIHSSIDDVLAALYPTGDNDQTKDIFSALILKMLTKSQLKDNFPCITIKSVESIDETTIKPRIPADLVDTLNDILSNAKPCDYSATSLPECSILDKILKIQKLDRLGADNVYNYYKSIQKPDEHRDTVQQLLNHFPAGLNPIESYLLSTMAKDCSILIAFQKVDNHSSLEKPGILAEDLVNNKFLFQVHVADVDLKPIQCIEKHYDRDIKVVEAALLILKSH